MHWLDPLARIRKLKLELARLDPRAGMPLSPPTGAAERGIAGVERKLGRPLPPSYREFLSQHDGWPQLFQRVSLLGVHHLARGSFVGLARMAIDLSPAGDPRPGLELVPFGVDPEGDTFFAWDLGAARDDGELGVILWTNQLGERVGSFPELLDFLAQMLEAEVTDRLGRHGVRSAPRSAGKRPVFPALASELGARGAA